MPEDARIICADACNEKKGTLRGPPRRAGEIFLGGVKRSDGEAEGFPRTVITRRVGRTGGCQYVASGAQGGKYRVKEKTRVGRGRNRAAGGIALRHFFSSILIARGGEEEE